jgi:hypothetical protein
MAPSAIGAPLAGRTRPAIAQRAGILAAIYLISYGGAAIPGLIAGQLLRTLSVFDIALGYGALAALACGATLLTARDPDARTSTTPVPSGVQRRARIIPA